MREQPVDLRHQLDAVLEAIAVREQELARLRQVREVLVRRATERKRDLDAREREIERELARLRRHGRALHLEELHRTEQPRGPTIAR